MNAPRGMTLMDVIVGTALILVVFLALLGLLRMSLMTAASSKARAGANAVATTQMEYVRSLEYGAVGTVGGIPPGPVPQYATTTLNGIPYGIRTLVQYVDDPKDGSGSNDSNGITTDYKRVRVAATFVFRGTTREVALVSNVAPPSIETTTNGGTLRVSVVNAAGLPVAGASVRVVNADITPAVDVTTFTDLEGAVQLPGAATSTAYQVAVTKAGYSSAQTYLRDATNQNPTPGYLTVVKNQTTTGTFAIDALSTLLVRTFSPVRPATFTDTFADTSKLSSVSSVQASGGALTLSGAPGSYALSGSARATTTAPLYIQRWNAVTANVMLPAGTAARISVTDSSGAPLPDSVLPGNGAGFTSFPISLTGISTTTYPGLALRADLTTSSATSTPEVLDWSIAYDEGPIPLPDVAFTLTGSKKKGTTGAGAPIFKTVLSTTTDVTGTRSLPLEWDVYDIVLPGRTIVSASTTPPYALNPGTSLIADLILQ